MFVHEEEFAKYQEGLKSFFNAPAESEHTKVVMSIFNSMDRLNQECTARGFDMLSLHLPPQKLEYQFLQYTLESHRLMQLLGISANVTLDQIKSVASQAAVCIMLHEACLKLQSQQRVSAQMELQYNHL